MPVRRLDHVAVPTDDMDAMLAFYQAMGFTVGTEFAPLAYSVCQGDMKINIHSPDLWRGGEFTLRGPTAQPGCGDLCMVWDGTEADLVAMLDEVGAEVIEGPVDREGGATGAEGAALVGSSRYTRDPDGNLLEFIIYPA